MASMSDYLENKVIDHVNGTAAYTSPSTVYVALFTSPTSDSGGGTEVSGGSYARQSITFGPASSGTAVSNVNIVFPKATAAWGVITHAAIMDAASGGNMLFHGPLNSSREIKTNDQFQFASGDITNSID